MPSAAKLRILLYLGAASLGTVGLQGCLLAAAGAGAGAGYQLSQDRSISDTVADAGIHAAITQSWQQYNLKMAEDLDNTVYEGRVLLTGDVPNEEWRDEAVKRAWQAQGVKEVYDEIQVGPTEGFTQDVSDDAITSKLKAQLIADGDVRSINYNITTVNGVVYIIGTASSQAELDRVVDHARNIADVRRVVSYVRINGSAPAAATAAASQPGQASVPEPTGAAPPPSSAASQPVSLPTPRQEINVQPLGQPQPLAAPAGQPRPANPPQ